MRLSSSQEFALERLRTLFNGTGNDRLYSLITGYNDRGDRATFAYTFFVVDANRIINVNSYIANLFRLRRNKLTGVVWTYMTAQTIAEQLSDHLGRTPATGILRSERI